MLAEVPDREIVIGAYTQPWHEHVTFHPLPPEEFAAFREPGYVRIVWTLAAEPAGPGESWFVTRTRVAATDPGSRKKFRRYWAPMSAGIILIRYAALPLVRKQAERQARQADKGGSQTVSSHSEWIPPHGGKGGGAMASRPDLDAVPKPITLGRRCRP